MFLNDYPYTDFHEMNADFVLKAVQALQQAFKDFTASNSLIFAEPLLHDITKSYAKNTIVLDPDGNAYISLQTVPSGVQLGNSDYWLMVFNFEDYTEKANKNFTVNYLRDTKRAPQAYAAGDWIVLDDVLYKASVAIAADDLFEVGTNIVHFTVEQFLKDFIQTVNNTLYNYSLTIQQYKNDIDASELAYRNQLAQDIADTTALLQAQLDLAISGATVDSEVINARLGADGVTYNTLGDAIRTQVQNIIDANTILNSPSDYYLAHISASTGQIITPSTYHTSEFIKVSEGDVIEYTNANGSSGVLLIGAYSAEGDATAVIASSLVGTNATVSGNFTIPAGINYIRLCNSNLTSPRYRIMPASFIKTQINTSNEPVNWQNITTGFTDCFISISTGQEVTSASYRTTGFIKVDKGEVFKFYGLNASSGVAMIAAYANENDNTAIISDCLVGKNSAKDGIYIVPEGVNYIRICALTTATPKVYRYHEDTISILFVGNSMTQDAVSYVPYLLKQFYPEIKFKFYMWYNGGIDLDAQYIRFTSNTPCDTFSFWDSNESGWTNRVSMLTMSDILSTYKFDIVVMQEYFNYRSTYNDITGWKNCQDYIEDHYTGGNALKFVSLLHAPKRDVIATVYPLSVQGNELIVTESVADDIIAPGTAIALATQTSLNNLGDAGGLSTDGTHAQEGLPSLLEAYVIVLWLLDKLGIPKSIYGLPFKMTTAIYNTINVPGPNLGNGVIEGTDAENLLAQELAVQAHKISRTMVAKAYEDISNI